jgi:hypothetical protein
VSKLAALGPAFWTSLALGAGASLATTAGLNATQRANDRAKSEWLNYQNRNKARLEGNETRGREAAQTAMQENLRMQGQDAREGVIDAETSRLEEMYGGGLPDVARDTLASSQNPGGNEVFDTAMAKGLAKATSDARDRIKALAKSSAYGGGTQFGMGQTLNDSYGEAATDIGFLNDQRRGDIGTLLRHQQVQPEIFEYNKPAFVSLMEAGSAIAGGMDPNSLSGLFGSGKMASSMIPKPNPRYATAGVARGAVPRFSFIPSAGGGLPGPR